MKPVMHSLSLIIAILLFSSPFQQADASASPAEATIDAFSGKPCFKCHRNKLTAPFVHDALAGNRCIPCHKLTNGNHQVDHWLAAAKERSAALCYECHENWSRQKSVHGPIQGGDCLGCHAPHAADNKNLLRFELQELCFECHGRSLVTAKETLTATGFRDGRQNLHQLHGDKNRIPCLTCHDAHASGQLHLIRLKGTGNRGTVAITHAATATGGTCATSCHDAAAYVRSEK